MRARTAIAAAAATALIAAGCGEETTFSEDEVLSAVGADGEGLVNEDEFCRIDTLLPSAEAIDEAADAGNTITSRDGNVGVVVEPPFPDDCQEIVRKGLNRLDAAEAG